MPSHLSYSYSTVYTTAPVFSLVLDVDVRDGIAMRYPELYKDLVKGRILSYKTFFVWLLISIYQGTVSLFSRSSALHYNVYFLKIFIIYFIYFCVYFYSVIFDDWRKSVWFFIWIGFKLFPKTYYSFFKNISSLVPSHQQIAFFFKILIPWVSCYVSVVVTIFYEIMQEAL